MTFIMPSLAVLGTPDPDALPVVNAGVDQTVLALEADLVGTATDPQGDALTTLWTLVSGPGSAVFSAATNLSSAVTFGAYGIYVLRLTATDSRGDVASDDITIAAAESASYRVYVPSFYEGISEPLDQRARTPFATVQIP